MHSVAVAQNGENRAIALANADLATVPQHHRRYMRYVWLEDERHESMQAVSLTLAYISRSNLITRPLPVPLVNPVIVRVDLRSQVLVTREKDLAEVIDTWEELRFAPRFNLLLTRDTLRFAAGVHVKTDWAIVDVPPFVAVDGKTYTRKWERRETPVNDIAKGDVVRAPAGHIDQVAYATLKHETQSEAAIVSHRYFILRALDTIQDDGVYRTVYGGLLYKFAGTKATLNEQLIELGVDPKDLDRLASDQRLAVFISGITGRDRRIDILPTRLLRVDKGQAIVSITKDLRAKTVDIGNAPLANLLQDNIDDAREIIWKMANGMDGFMLTNGKGERQDVVPEDVATDGKVPHPYRPTFGAGISCIVCHGPERGWRTLTNDVKALIGRKTGIDIFPFRKQGEIDILVAKYGGDVERPGGLLPRARDDLSRATLEATGPWKKGKKDLTDVAQIAAAELGEIRRYVWHQGIDAKMMLDDWNVKCKDNTEAVVKLRVMLPPAVADKNGDQVPEDFRAAGLLAGLRITRTQFDLLYSFAAARAQAAMKRKGIPK